MDDARHSSFPKQGHAALHSPADLQGAIESLLMRGFNRADISVVALEETVKQAALDGAFCKVNFVTDSNDIETQAPVDSHSMKEGQAAAIGLPAYIGAMAAGIAGAATGGVGAVIIGVIAGGAGGAAVGGALARWVGDKQSAHLQDQLDCGGLILWTTIHNDAQEQAFRRSLSDYPDVIFDIR